MFQFISWSELSEEAHCYCSSAGVTVPDQEQQQPGLKDEVRRLSAIKVADGRVKSIDLVMGRGQELRVYMPFKQCHYHKLSSF
jgi:hypothetical protein